MAAAPVCITCNIEPTRNRHDVRQYECPKCGGIFRLLMQPGPLVSDDVAMEKPPARAGTR